MTVMEQIFLFIVRMKEDLLNSGISQLKSFHWTEKMALVNLALMLVSIPFDSGVGLLFACLWILSIALTLDGIRISRTHTLLLTSC